MSSVTERIKEIKQPRGGYIKPSQFKTNMIDDGNVLSENENVHAALVGSVVDYLTRFTMGSDKKEAFAISLNGAEWASLLGYKSVVKDAQKYLKNIHGLDDDSIVNACKIATFDVWFRNPMGALLAKTAVDINPDSDTINNIRIMVERSDAFWKQYGPITKTGFTFEKSGYTKTVNSGDGDYLTKDTLWDFKVSKSKPKSEHTLQLLMYWIMGQHSGKAEFKGIKKLGIFNPRLNTVYTLNIEDVPSEIIEEVETNVICY